MPFWRYSKQICFSKRSPSMLAKKSYKCSVCHNSLQIQTICFKKHSLLIFFILFSILFQVNGSLAQEKACLTRTQNHSDQDIAEPKLSFDHYFYALEYNGEVWKIVTPKGDSTQPYPEINRCVTIRRHESVSHINHRQEYLDESHPDNIDHSLGFPMPKFRSYRSIMGKHLKNNEISDHQVCFRGDSRPPEVIWNSGGFWAIDYHNFYKQKVKGNRKYSVMLHQSSPGTQDVVSSSSSANVAKRFSIPVLKQSGYNYALWSGQGIGVSLAAVNQSRGTLSWNYVRDKVLRDEQEIAFPGGLPKTYILGARQTVEVRTKEGSGMSAQVVYGPRAFVSRQLLLGDSDLSGSEPENVLQKVVSDLFETTDDEARGIIGSLRDQIQNDSYADRCLKESD